MSRPHKRLRRLIDVRRRQEEAARVQLARSMEQAAELSDEVRVRTEALESVLAGSTEPHRGSQIAKLVEITRPAILAARAAEASAMNTVVEIRQEWTRAAIRLKGLERLDEKQTESARLVEVREENRQADDAIVGRLGKETP